MVGAQHLAEKFDYIEQIFAQMLRPGRFRVMVGAQHLAEKFDYIEQIFTQMLRPGRFRRISDLSRQSFYQ